MKFSLTLCSLLFFVLPSFCQKDGQIISSVSVVYPAYENVKDISKYYEKSVYDKTITDKNFNLEKITYYSDNLKVVAYLAGPKNLDPKKKYPVIIFNRGSYIRNDIAYVHAPLFRKFVENGFIVIAPALRESEGGEGKDEMGGKDLHDIWNALMVLKTKAYADTDNLFMYGESRGGVMTLEVLKEGFPVKAAATVGAFTNFSMYVKENPGLEPFCRQLWTNYDERKDTIAAQRSAVLWVDRIHVPLLIMAGSEDKSVNPHHSLDLGAKLNELHSDYQFLIVNGGNHVLSGKSSDKRDTEIINWFQQHLTK